MRLGLDIPNRPPYSAKKGKWDIVGLRPQPSERLPTRLAHFAHKYLAPEIPINYQDLTFRAAVYTPDEDVIELLNTTLGQDLTAQYVSPG
jgi:hypothetical protein